jgi:hypothetical protein
MKNYRWLLPVVLLLLSLVSCNKEEEDSNLVVSADFESGSIGQTELISNTELSISLADDNNNPDLPDSWRSWWYISIDHVDTKRTTSITIKNEGWPFYYLPVYSYNQVDWIRFGESEVTQKTEGLLSGEIGELTISKKFDQNKVWIARFYPYTFSDLQKQIHKIEKNPLVTVSVPGYSQQGNPIYLLRITNPTIDVSRKKRIFMHGRTHSAETPPSFLIEGMVDFLLSGSEEAMKIVSAFEFYIFPMQNVDGVIEGNYRSTPKSENLEMLWLYDSQNPVNLTAEAPNEVKAIHDYAVTLMQDGAPQVSMALNLHASNSEPDVRPFFYPHFGSETKGYSQQESSLWEQQLAFIDKIVNNVGADLLEPIPEDGGGSFAGKTYPESWWWVNYKDKVIAMTMEMTYGRSGYSPRWIVPAELRNLGEKLIVSINDYYNPSLISPVITMKNIRIPVLKYPELYGPRAIDEMKE